MHIGNNKLDLEDTDSAYIYFFKALHLREKIQDNRGLITTYISLADIYIHEYDNIDSAYFYASKALSLANEIKDGFGKLKAEIVIARYNVQNGNYKKAIDLLKPSIEFLEQQQMHAELAEIFEIL